MDIPDGLQYALFVFGAIGAIYVLVLVIKLLMFLINILYWYSCPLSNQQLRAKFQRYGKWAVVTGCTDGIGKEFALQLAEAKLNVVLISRSQDKLDRTAQEIMTTHQVETRTIAADFGSADMYERIRDELQGLDIGVLVNNVGMDQRYPMRFDEVDANDVMRVLNCNTVSLLKMTHTVLPTMVRNRRGLIVNVGSTGALIPLPFIALYVATKVFLDSFSQSLALEYAAEGIEVQTLLPGYLATKLSGDPDPSFMVKLPRDYVQAALRSAGRARRCTGCGAHEMQAEFIRSFVPLMPFGLRRRIFVKEMLKMRERKIALERAANQQAGAEKLQLLPGTSEPR